MIWLELRTNNRHYNNGWNFSESVWAPISKSNGTRWPFYSLLGDVVKGDIIFHLRQRDQRKQFVGYSFANSDGYLTYEKPTDNIHEWDYSKAFYKVDIVNFTTLEPVIELSEFFFNNDFSLREHFLNKGKKHLFYVIQKDRLQCLFGAYFSEFNDLLPYILNEDFGTKNNEINAINNVSTALKQLKQRIGHQIFSENVKRNFNFKCCFPNCNVEGRGFLISGHIARWADNEFLRGHTGNGLCFCLMHDKAFEKGLFTLNEEFKIILNKDYKYTQWQRELLDEGEYQEIKCRKINPLIEALKLHWKRVGLMIKYLISCSINEFLLIQKTGHIAPFFVFVFSWY